MQYHVDRNVGTADDVVCAFPRHIDSAGSRHDDPISGPDDHDGGLHQRGCRDNPLSRSTCGYDRYDLLDEETVPTVRDDRNRSGRVVRRVVHRPIFRPTFEPLRADAAADTALTMGLRNTLSAASKAVAVGITQVFAGRNAAGGGCHVGETGL